MQKFEYNTHPRTKPAEPINPAILPLKIQFLKDCKIFSTHTKDTGFKGGFKTTAYEHANDNYVIRHWQGDAEQSHSVLCNGNIIAHNIDCWGKGYFEFTDENSLNVFSTFCQKMASNALSPQGTKAS
jgi:hypothetical protein